MPDGKPALGYLVFDDNNALDIDVAVLAARLQLEPLHVADTASARHTLSLVYRDDQWQLCVPDSRATVAVDFASGRLTARLSQNRVYQEHVVRAVVGRSKSRQSLYVLDATAGFGTDAFLLAAAGCKVSMIEQIPLMTYLLEQALLRARASTQQQIKSPAERLDLIHGDSADLMKAWNGRRPDIVYLDPMYDVQSAMTDRDKTQYKAPGNESNQRPQQKTKKSAAVKKHMALLQHIVSHRSDADDEQRDLIHPALALATKKVVVKREPSAGWLGTVKPSSSLTGKAARFDIYAL